MSRKVPKNLLSLALLPYVCAVTAPIMAQVGALSPRVAFNIFLFAGLAGIVNSLMGLFFVFRKRFLSALIMGVGILPLVLMLALAASSGGGPLINDITTTPGAPLTFAQPIEGKLPEYPEEFAEQQKQGYPDLGPLLVARTPTDVFPIIERVVARLENVEIILADRDAGILQGKQTSGLFRFVDDFVITVQPMGEGSRIEMRSRSRVGKGDLGANAHRIENVLADIREEVAGGNN